MKRRSLWPWLVLLIWNVWLYAAAGRLASAPLFGWLGGPWVPDLGLVLLLGLESHLSAREARVAAVLAALGRAAFSADPALALIAGYLGAVWLARALRAVLEADRPLSRAVITGALALALSLYFGATRIARLGEFAAEVVLPVGAAWRAGLASAAASLVILPLLLRLPGLSPLQRRET